MGLLISNYESETGLTLDSAYACPINIYYDDMLKNLNFELAIYSSEQAYFANKKPVEIGTFFGILPLTYSGHQNLFDVIDNAILIKANDVHDKTDEEITEHNAAITYNDGGATWLYMWDRAFDVFYGAQKVERENYIEEMPPEA